MDLTQSIEARSDQLNADDLHHPITYTIRDVVQGKAEQPFDFMLVETERAYRPSKTMRRMIVEAWGPDAKVYTGRRLTLYREPSIRFGKDIVGGIRISHMSHIPKRVEGKFQTTRGKRETFTVDPLPELPTSKPAPILTALIRAFDDAGITEKNERLNYCNDHLDRHIESATELTPDEMTAVIRVLESHTEDPWAGQEPTDA
jgi:hypothetical protein